MKASASSKICTDARCVGSLPNSPDTNNAVDESTGVRIPDENYKIDYEQIRSIGIHYESMWLASYSDGGSIGFNEELHGLYLLKNGLKGSYYRNERQRLAFM